MDNSYIQTLIENGEYDELLTFLIAVLPDTKIEVDNIEDCVKLYIGQAEFIEEMEETVTEFKLRVSHLKRGKSQAERNKWNEFVEKHIEAAIVGTNQIDGINSEQSKYLLWFTQALRQIGIKLENWQKEDLRTIFALQIKKNR